jgi:hypothetical protein
MFCLFFSCENSTTAKKETEMDKALNVLKSQGYQTDDIIVLDDHNFVIEGDIKFNTDDILHPKSLGKQYHTHNLLNNSQVQNIRVRIDGSVSYNWAQGTRNAMQNWNNISGVKVNFVEVSSAEDVRVRQQNVQAGFLAFATFPQYNGRAGYDITVGAGFANRSITDQTRTMTHEFGHTLGLRHTNWFDRNSDGNQSDNEGAGSIGANHIPNTPTSYSSWSIMNAFDNHTGNNFNSADLISIRYLYPSGSNGTISVGGPSSANANEKKWFTINNHSGSGNWWYKENGGSWQNIGTYSTVWVQLSNSYTVAVGVNGTYYYKEVTVY